MKRALLLMAISLSHKGELSDSFVIVPRSIHVGILGLPTECEARRRRTTPFVCLQSTNADAFDFSSKTGWNQFYEKRARPSDDQLVFEPYEWHSSLDHDVVFQLVERGGSILFVGCGSSAMPLELHDRHQGETHITCLDYSPSCIEQLAQSWGSTRSNMSFVCGDATRLETVPAIANGDERTDAIIDKGLIDALMCGEGWNGDVERLLTSAAKQLKTNGLYILASYKLSSATKDFLLDVGKEVGLEWTFDLEDEDNTRVSLSKAVMMHN
eukprot:CAMPEP_0197715666 /NCGR_PEP_ID=MMETSP1434-20131217/784_1 /TAXON_ID=265543 /ORGANISM="Minutocellus polymorphus, Strain CCMP3303" /LENGTH=268 /DNA_ID=CAMNT_0043299855 /DNA_START=87 /DNA_END=893 /DNA_ORIENTATION=+